MHLLIHIGLPRTGSTWLQKVGFPTHPEITLGNRLGTQTSLSINTVFSSLYRGENSSSVTIQLMGL